MSATGSYIASWSGGKDSCNACYQAIKQGLRVSRLLHFNRPLNLHGLSHEIIQFQAQLAGIQLANRRVANEEFEQKFKRTVRELQQKADIRGMIFGDIYLEPHREWIERVCNELAIEPVLPLWGKNTEQLLDNFLEEGFETVIVSGRDMVIDKSWIGRTIGPEFLSYLKEIGLDACGEQGEYHTLVTGGPLFRGRIKVSGHGVVNRHGHWFYDISEYQHEPLK